MSWFIFQPRRFSFVRETNQHAFRADEFEIVVITTADAYGAEATGWEVVADGANGIRIPTEDGADVGADPEFFRGFWLANADASLLSLTGHGWVTTG